MEQNLKLKKQNNCYTLIAICIIAVGVLVRIINFGKLPYGFNQDEAFAAYEAFSMLNYGVDSAGNINPTYFVSWGSGMNVLQSYLAIPFMWLFGYSEAVYRLPSLLCGLISLPVFWLLIKRLWNEKIAIIALGLLCISPWHINISRWGLESNLAPAFLLFGLYFLIKGITKNVWFLLSAFFYGLALYTYSITWITIPLTLILFGIYILKTASQPKKGYVIGAVIILFLFAIPHILFLLVNTSIIPEIKTVFITIPKMVAMRSSEVSLLNIFNVDSWANLFRILLLQYDGINHNAYPFYGMFYHISTPFLIIGFIALFKRLIADIKVKNTSGAYFILGGFLIHFIASLIIFNLNINKSNGMHFFTLAIISFGIYTAFKFVKHNKIAISAVCIIFALHFCVFCGYYFNAGQNEISNDFSGDLAQAVELANEENCKKIAVDRSVYHSQIMYYDKTEQKVFEDTVKYENYPSPYLKATAFGKYTFISEYNKLGNYDAFIFPHSHIGFFNDNDFEITIFEKYAVAIRK